MLDCKCSITLRYTAQGDTMKVMADKIDYCPRHDAEPLIAALEEFVSITSTHSGECGCEFCQCHTQASAALKRAKEL